MIIENLTKEANESSSKDNLKEDFSKLKKEAKDILARIKEAGSEVSGSLGKDAMQLLQETASESNAKAQEYIDTLEESIKNRPILSAVVAFGVGMFIARMTSWTSHR